MANVRTCNRPARRRRRAVTGAVLLVSVVMSAACSGDDDGAADLPSVTTTAAGGDLADVSGANPIDDSPFCRQVLELESGDEPPDRSEVIERYTEMSPDVPDEIRPEFDVVLEHLRQQEAGAAPADADADADPIVEESTRRFAAYIAQQCRGTDINPLPPPTQPLDEPDAA
jgi:hypothetical protein